MRLSSVRFRGRESREARTRTSEPTASDSGANNARGQSEVEIEPSSGRLESAMRIM
jgi:hypothetical protein